MQANLTFLNRWNYPFAGEGKGENVLRILIVNTRRLVDTEVVDVDQM